MTNQITERPAPRSLETQFLRRMEPRLEQTPLVNAVLDSVRQVQEGNLRRVASPDAGIAFQPRSLLALLTYCYAAGIYGSQDIEALMGRDAGFRRYCQEEFPDWRRLRRFRRENRQVLESCLEGALRNFWRDARDDGPASGGGGPVRRAGAGATDAAARPLVFADARNRLEWAMLLDSEAGDD